MRGEQQELFAATAPEPQTPADGRSWIVPPWLPVLIPADGTWRVTTQPSGGRLVELIEDSDDATD